LNEIIGATEFIDQTRAIEHWKARGLDFSKLFQKPENYRETPPRRTGSQRHDLENVLDRTLIEAARPALEERAAVLIERPIRNTDRAVGAMLSGQIAKRYGHAGLPDDTVTIKFAGVSGQSFGAFLAHGVTLDLVGEANDYVGKGLSGGRVVVRPAEGCGIVPEESIIVGNTVLYGAIAGECYFRGIAGERFAVRNSGAVAVVEGVGDHGCEYMTGGIVIVIGETGRNFAAGMSGGVAYVLDMKGDFRARCNLAMVDLAPVPAEEETIERLHHHGGDLEHHGLVDVSADMTRHDAERIWHLVGRHYRYTGSTRARSILDAWDRYLPKFVKIMPVEYRRALLELERAQAGSDGMQIGLARGA
jgi:glutamate synthase (NADPH/NADH) large chain